MSDPIDTPRRCRAAATAHATLQFNGAWPAAAATPAGIAGRLAGQYGRPRTEGANALAGRSSEGAERAIPFGQAVDVQPTRFRLRAIMMAQQTVKLCLRTLVAVAFGTLMLAAGLARAQGVV